MLIDYDSEHKLADDALYDFYHLRHLSIIVVNRLCKGHTNVTAIVHLQILLLMRAYITCMTPRKVKCFCLLHKINVKYNH